MNMGKMDSLGGEKQFLSGETLPTAVFGRKICLDTGNMRFILALHNNQARQV